MHARLTWYHHRVTLSLFSFCLVSNIRHIWHWYTHHTCLKAYVTQHLGLSSEDASAITAVMAASTTVGRISIG